MRGKTNTVICNCSHSRLFDSDNFLRRFAETGASFSRIYPAKTKPLSHQITSHLNTHIVRILQINLIRILLPGVHPGCSQLHCVWMKLMSSRHSGVASHCFASCDAGARVSARRQKRNRRGRLQVQHEDAARQVFRADGLGLEEAAGHTHTETSVLSWLAYLIRSAVIWRSWLWCSTMSAIQC